MPHAAAGEPLTHPTGSLTPVAMGLWTSPEHQLSHLNLTFGTWIFRENLDQRHQVHILVAMPTDLRLPTPLSQYYSIGSPSALNFFTATGDLLSAAGRLITAFWPPAALPTTESCNHLT